MEGGICQSIDTPPQRHYKHHMKRTLFMLLAGLLTLTACNLPALTPPPPTETPTLTATITLTPTQTPIPPPTSTPTPVPALLIAKGQKALADGDYLTAKDSYQAALDSSTQANAKAEAESKAKAQAEKAQPARTRNTKPADADEESGSEELLAQLSGSAQPDKRRRSDKISPPGRSNNFNPFLNAALPRTKRS